MEKTYTGSCHCGRVRFEVRTEEVRSAVSCNCSICQRTGSLLAFLPAANFTLLSGEEALTDYQFNKKAIHHLFCNTCGIRSFARGTAPDGSPMVALNLRCVDELDLGALDLTHYDGRSA